MELSEPVGRPAIDRLKLYEVVGTWSLDVFEAEGDRYWTRFQHWLTANSIFFGAAAVILASSNQGLTPAVRSTLILALSVTAATLDWLWVSIVGKGAHWHRIFGERFDQINRALISDAGTAGIVLPSVFPPGVFELGKGREQRDEETRRAGGILFRTRVAIIILAAVWTLVAIVAAVWWYRYLPQAPLGKESRLLASTDTIILAAAAVFGPVVAVLITLVVQFRADRRQRDFLEGLERARKDFEVFRQGELEGVFAAFKQAEAGRLSELLNTLKTYREVPRAALRTRWRGGLTWRCSRLAAFAFARAARCARSAQRSTADRWQDSE